MEDLRIEGPLVVDHGAAAADDNPAMADDTQAGYAHGEARPRYEWITSCRSNMRTNCSIFFARVSALFTVWIRNRMAYRLALFSVAKNAFAFGCASRAR